ncbi:MAG: glycosyltransferase family 8 protein [Defluviitaleaceae bacterium]|nr:glycosyltransferase family 8 protein [Defluviitaleaceae bacterium]
MNAVYSLNDFEMKAYPLPDTPSVMVPAFDKNNVAVCIVSSDEYAPFAGVVIHSLIMNCNPLHNYDIVILSDDMTMANHRRLSGLRNGNGNVSIRIVNIENLIKNMTFYTWAHFTAKTYYRLLVPEIFANYPKVVYLDSDTVVNCDIAKMFNTDLDGYYMAAAYDTHIVGVCHMDEQIEQRVYNRDVLEMKNPDEYFQAGVSLYNVAAIKRDFEPGYLIKQAAVHKLRWLDQDLINKLFHGKIKRLPIRWNVMVANVMHDVREFFLKPDLFKEYAEARLNPYIIHYVGRAIPCFSDTPDMFERFWFYARQTPYYEVILQLLATESVKRTAPLCFPLIPQSIVKERRSIRKRFKKIMDFFLPRGTKRRLFAYNIFVKIRGYGKVKINET